MPDPTSSCRLALDVAIAASDLAGHFEKIYRERLQGLRIVKRKR